MINLRYHIVSLVAVFFALGMGILMGSTVIDQGIVNRLELQTRSLDNRLSTARIDNDALKRREDIWEAFGKSMFTSQTAGKLKGRPFVIVTQEGADTHEVDAVAQSLTEAGGIVAGRITLLSKWLAKDQPTRDALTTATGLAQPVTGDVVAQAATKFGTRMASSSDPALTSDTIALLRDAGFLSFDTTVAGAFPGAGTTIVVIPSASKDLRPAQLFFPFLQALSKTRPVAVAETIETTDSLIDRVRGDGSLRTTVATVDIIDSSLGRLSLVLGLRTLLSGDGALHYGTRRGATALAPTVFGG